MLHLRPVPRKYSFVADAAYAETHTRLRNEIEEAKMDSRLPRHFKARELFRKQGEIA